MMRLRTEEVKMIKNSVKKVFGEDAIVFLFGSRTDDTKKGGDIDLYIETLTRERLFYKKISLIQQLYKQLGEQKIDVIINHFTQFLNIYKVARREGILL